MRLEHPPGDGHGATKKGVRKSIVTSDGIDFFFIECLKPKLISLSCWWRSSRMFERFLQHLSLDWRNGHCCSRGDSAWEISSEGSACVLLSEAEGHWTAGVTPALSRGAWGELSVWNPLKKNENSTKIRQNYINRKRQLLFPYEWFCRQENLRQMLQMPPLVH